MQINGEPIGAKLSFEKPIRTGHPVAIKLNFPRVDSAAKYFHVCKVIPNHFFTYGGNTEKSCRK